jgi:hypothetical protein
MGYWPDRLNPTLQYSSTPTLHFELASYVAKYLFGEVS